MTIALPRIIENENCLGSLLIRGEYERALNKVGAAARKPVRAQVKNDQDLWLLPIHVACALPQVPFAIIEALVKEYPEGLMCETVGKKFQKSGEIRTSEISTESNKTSTSFDSLESFSIDAGWLPIHTAALYGMEKNTLQYLLQAAPGCIYCKTGQGFLPLHVSCLVIDTSFHQIEFLIEEFPLSIYVPTSDGAIAQRIAESNTQGGLPRKIKRILAPKPLDKIGISESPRPSHSIISQKEGTLLKKTKPPRRMEKVSEKVPILFKALSDSRWSDALKHLSQKPEDASIWTLSPNPKDPPCHLLPFHICIRRNAPLHVVKAVIAAEPSATKRREFMGMLPLHVACTVENSIELITYLIETYPKAAAKIDAVGMLPLHKACISGSHPSDTIVELLKAYPKALRTADNKAFLPQDYVSRDAGSLLKIFKRGEEFWEACEIKKNTLSNLICQKQFDTAKLRLQEKPKEARIWTVHPFVPYRYLALHYACILNAPTDLVKALLEAYPDALSLDCQEHDMLPLHLACQHSARPQTVEVLLDSYARAAAIPDSHGLLPLHLACTQGASTMVIQMLTRANPDSSETTDHKGHTPKFYAKNSRHPSILQSMEVLEQPEYSC